MPPKNADVKFIKNLLSMYEQTKGREVAFVEAARWGALDELVRLHQSGVDVNCRGLDDVTALMAAASAAEVEVVRYLLKHGADVSLRMNRGRAALLAAVGGMMPERRVFKVVQMLLESGADISDIDQDGLTAYSVAKPKYSDKVWGLLQPLSEGS